MKQTITVRDACRFVQRHGIVTESPTRGWSSIVEEVAGGPVKGSWWGHPRGKTIYAIGEALRNDPDVLTIKLVRGKIAFVHRDVWPPLYRFLKSLPTTGLSRGAKSLLARVKKEGEIDIRERELIPAKNELESRLLVQAWNVHTEKGSHATVIRSWEKWVPRDVKSAAAGWELDSAKSALRI